MLFVDFFAARQSKWFWVVIVSVSGSVDRNEVNSLDNSPTVSRCSQFLLRLLPDCSAMCFSVVLFSFSPLGSRSRLVVLCCRLFCWECDQSTSSVSIGSVPSASDMCVATTVHYWWFQAHQTLGILLRQLLTKVCILFVASTLVLHVSAPKEEQPSHLYWQSRSCFSAKGCWISKYS